MVHLLGPQNFLLRLGQISLVRRVTLTWHSGATIPLMPIIPRLARVIFANPALVFTGIAKLHGDDTQGLAHGKPHGHAFWAAAAASK